MEKAKKKTIELWDGYEVEVNEQLMDDFDFILDLSTAQKNNDMATIVTMYFALIGGEGVYQEVREHIEAEKGYFSQKDLLGIIEKVNNVLPKAGNRSQRRSWQATS